MTERGRYLLRTPVARETHDALVRQERSEQKLAALTEVAKWPGGIMPLAGLTVNMLDQLMNRGLVERRYALSRLALLGQRSRFA